MNITVRQKEIYNFIAGRISKRGIPPTMREIGEEFGIRSTNGVDKHLAALERSGLIRRERGKSHGIRLESEDLGISSKSIRGIKRLPRASGHHKNQHNNSEEGAAERVPLLGRVAAGMPVLAEENREGDLAVDLSFFKLRSSEGVFALTVRGNSMIEAHIVEGDRLLVRAQSTADDRDIIVAMVDGETTVKRLVLEKDRIRLQPENRTMPPIYVQQEDLRVLGKVVGVMRVV